MKKAVLNPPQGENKKWYMDAAREKGLYVFAGYSEEYKDHPHHANPNTLFELAEITLLAIRK